MLDEGSLVGDSLWRAQRERSYDDEGAHLAGPDALDEGCAASSAADTQHAAHIRTFQVVVDHACAFVAVEDVEVVQ